MNFRSSANPIKATFLGSELPPWKRLFDIICCVIALPVLIVCTLLMTIITKLTSPGPVIFRQERVGYQGRRFKIYKFRSMHVNFDSKRHQSHFKSLVGSKAPMQKLDNQIDAWLIPGSWIIRASGLDELPQIINVLSGEMSLIGPRPCLPAEANLYQPEQRERFNTLPGLTGLWQVSGKNRTTFDEMIDLDIRYTRTKSWWLDLKIIVLTGPALIRQIYDTVTGRRKAIITEHTTPPFSIGASRPPLKSQ